MVREFEVAVSGWRDVQVQAGKPLRGTLLRGPSGRLTFTLPKELVSVNKWYLRHWRVKYTHSQAWETMIRAAVCDYTGATDLPRVLLVMSMGHQTRTQTPKLVTITRMCPSLKRFIRDDDNLSASCKPLLDAIKRCGLIKDDARKWCELIVAPQVVSPDGLFWTIVEIEPLGREHQ